MFSEKNKSLGKFSQIELLPEMLKKFKLKGNGIRKLDLLKTMEWIKDGKYINNIKNIFFSLNFFKFNKLLKSKKLWGFYKICKSKM